MDGKRRYILCFNPQLFKDQQKARQQAVANFRTFVTNLNLELLGAKKSRQRKPTYAKFKKRLEKIKLSGFVNMTSSIKHVDRKDSGHKHKIRTYQATVVVDDNKMHLAGKRDGFWLFSH